MDTMVTIIGSLLFCGFIAACIYKAKHKILSNGTRMGL